MALHYCPGCQAVLLPGAMKCSCGWIAPEEVADNKHCAAHGCPLSASRFAGHGTQGSGYCTWHYEQRSENFDRITRWIQRRAEVIYASQKFQALAVTDGFDRDRYARASIPVQPYEKPSDYAERLHWTLQSEFRKLFMTNKNLGEL